MSLPFFSLFALVHPALAGDLTLGEAPHDTVCAPHVSGPTPAWWNAGLSATKKAARWSGASVVKESSGSHTARTRALYDPAAGELFLEVLVSGDPSLDPDDDLVLVALGDETGEGPSLFLNIAPLAGCGVAGACEGAGAELPAGAILYSEASLEPTSITWSEPGEDNPSADFEISHPWVVAHAAGDVWSWTLSLVLTMPTDAAGEIRPDQRIYTNAVGYWPGWTSGTFTELPILCESSSPTTDDCMVNFDALTELPLDLPIGNFDESWPELRSDCGL